MVIILESLETLPSNKYPVNYRINYYRATNSINCDLGRENYWYLVLVYFSRFQRVIMVISYNYFIVSSEGVRIKLSHSSRLT